MADTAPEQVIFNLFKKNKNQPGFFQTLVAKLHLNQDPVVIEGDSFARQTVITALVQWGSINIPGFDPQKVLNNNFSQVSAFITEQLIPRAKEEVEQTVVPTEKIKALQAQMRTRDDWLAQQIATTDDQNLLTRLCHLDLDKQIQILEKANKSVFDQAIQMAPDNWPPDQKMEFAKEVSRGVVERTIIQQLAGEKINENSLRTSLTNLVDENPTLSIALNQEKIQSLTEKIAPDFLPPKPDQTNPHLEQIAKARKTIIQAQLEITPTYEESRVKIEAALQRELGLSEKKAQEFCWRLEANLQKHPTPHTQEEDYPLTTAVGVRKAVRDSFNTNDFLHLGSKNKTADDLVQQLSPLAQIHQAHLVLTQHPLEWQGLSHTSIKEATKLIRKNFRVDGQIVTAQAIENLSRGLTAATVLEELKWLQVHDADPAKIAKLQSLYRQMQAIDPKVTQVLPWRLRRRIRKAQRKAEFLGFLDKANPFGFQFWHKIMPTEAQWLKDKITQIKNQISLLEDKKYNFFQKYNPLSLYNRSLRQYKRQLLWDKTVSRMVKSSGLGGNEKLRQFLIHLPQKLKNFRPSSIPRAAFNSMGRFIGRQTGKLLIKLGTTELGKKILGGALKTAGETILKDGLTKGLVWLFGSALTSLGLSPTGVGAIVGGALAVIGAAWTAIKYAVKLAGSKEGQEIIKTIIGPIIGLIGTGLHFALSFLMAHKFALLGSLLGSFFGPTGIAAGGFLGYLTDSQLVPFLQKAGLGGGAGSMSGIFGQLLGAGTTTGAVAGSGFWGFLITPAAAVPLSFTSIFLFFTVQNLTTSSAFVGPAELGGGGKGIEEYVQDKTLRVSKTASPTTASTGQIITYRLEISSEEGGLKNVIIDDNPDLTKLEIISINPQPTNNTTMVWDINQMFKEGKISQDFSNAGATLVINYTARVKAGLTPKDKIYNQVTVTAANQKGEKINRKAYVIINSDCQDIVAKAAEIMNDLVMASSNQCKQVNSGCVNWILENRWEGYLRGYNCPISSSIRQQTDPLSTTDGCVVCNDLVTMSYLLTSHPNPQTTGWENTVQKWKQQNILLIENGKGNISQISSGDIVYFNVKRTKEDGSTYLDKFSHVGIVAGVTSAGIYTWEANTPNNGQRYYSYSAGSFLPLGGVVFVSAVGNTCQE